MLQYIEIAGIPVEFAVNIDDGYTDILWQYEELIPLNLHKYLLEQVSKQFGGQEISPATEMLVGAFLCVILQSEEAQGNLRWAQVIDHGQLVFKKR